MRGAVETQYREREGLADLLRSGLIPNWTVAIDGGAHVGTWTELMAARFESVIAFEPSPAFESLEFNAREWLNVTIANAALADEHCAVEVFHPHPRKSGKLTNRKVRKVKGAASIALPIDSLVLAECGLIKLDIEGFEYPAIMGARDTIARCRPFVLVELYGRGVHIGKTDQDVVDLLRSMGYRECWQRHVDHGFLPEESIR